MNELVKIFTSWEPLLKSVSHQEKVSRVALLLQDKSPEDITFTAVNVDGTLEKFVLGSYEGNTKFLLGLANPGFCAAPYHYVIIDPSLSDEEAEMIYEAKGHPAIPGYWESLGFSAFLEGDLENGKPLEGSDFDSAIDEKFTFKFNGQTYEADPEQQLISTNRHYFHWSLVKDTYLSSQNPDVVNKMTPFAESTEVVHKSLFAARISNLAHQYNNRDWEDSVFPLVKSIFPKPGSLLRLEDENSESVYAVFTADSVELFRKSGERAILEAWGAPLDGIDLSTEGNPALILGFATKYLDFDKTDVELYA